MGIQWKSASDSDEASPPLPPPPLTLAVAKRENLRWWSLPFPVPWGKQSFPSLPPLAKALFMGSARVSPIIIRSISHQKYLPNAKEMKWLLKQFCLLSPIVESLTGMISEGRGGKRRVLDFSSLHTPLPTPPPPQGSSQRSFSQTKGEIIERKRM